MLTAAGRFKRLHQPDPTIHRTIDTARAFFGGVFEPELDGINSQLLRDLGLRVIPQD